MVLAINRQIYVEAFIHDILEIKIRVKTIKSNVPSNFMLSLRTPIGRIVFQVAPWNSIDQDVHLAKKKHKKFETIARLSKQLDNHLSTLQLGFYLCRYKLDGNLSNAFHSPIYSSTPHSMRSKGAYDKTNMERWDH